MSTIRGVVSISKHTTERKQDPTNFAVNSRVPLVLFYTDLLPPMIPATAKIQDIRKPELFSKRTAAVRVDTTAEDSIMKQVVARGNRPCGCDQNLCVVMKSRVE